MRLKRLWQHMQQGRAQQHTGRQANQMTDDQAEQGCGQGCRQHDRRNTTQQSGQNDIEQGHLLILATLSSLSLSKSHARTVTQKADNHGYECTYR